MPGPTGGVRRARSRAWVVAVTLVAAACSGDTESFDLVAEPDATSTAPNTTQASDSAPPADDDDDRDTTVPETTVPADPTAGATTTTAPPEDDQRAAAVCDDLRSAPFETRRQLVADADASAVATDRCPEDLARSSAAVAMRDRVNAVAASTDTPIQVEDVSCNVSTERLTFSARNATIEPVGANIGVTLFDAGGQPIGAATEPIVVWRLAPGETVSLDVGLTPVAVTDGVRCELAGAWFLAETGDVDTGLPGVQDAELASDDPAVWLRGLGETLAAAATTGDTAAVADVEDLRSTDFDAVAASIESGEAITPAEITICAASNEGSPTAEWRWVAYAVEPAQGDPYAEVGVFRRGSDGQWRWLSRAHRVGGSAFADC